MSESTTGTIWCPEWCRFTPEHHQAEVAAGDTELVHQSDPMAARPMDSVLTTLRTIDGTPVLEDPSHEPVMFLDGDEYVSPDEFVQHAEETLRFVEMARRTGPHSWLECPSWCDYQGRDHGCMDVIDGRRTESHWGKPFGNHIGLHVEFFADTGQEVKREVDHVLDDDSRTCDGTTEVVDYGALVSIGSQAARAAAWLIREVEIP